MELKGGRTGGRLRYKTRAEAPQKKKKKRQRRGRREGVEEEEESAMYLQH
jgi:hypothetical protein